MGEYTSPAKKGREIATALMLFGVAIGIYYLSLIPKIPYPVLYQTVSFVLLACAVIVVTRFVMRRYTCKLDCNSKGGYDFVIIEHYGKKNTVVCRVFVEQILFVDCYNKQVWKEMKRNEKGKRVYCYTADFFDPNLAIAKIAAEQDRNETAFLLKFTADRAFLNLLEQNLSAHKNNSL